MRAYVVGMGIPRNADGNMDDLLGLPIKIAFLNVRKFQLALVVLHILCVRLIDNLMNTAVKSEFLMRARQ